MNTEGFEVKNVKTFVGMEGEGFNCTLYKDGKRIAFVIDSAQGGEYQFQWVDHKLERVDIKSFDLKGDEITYKGTPLEKVVVDFVNTLPPEDVDFHDETVRVDLDIFVAHLVEQYEEAKQLKGWCRKKTLFVLKGDEGGHYRTVTAPYGEKVKDFITEKYGDQVEEIINERFL